MEIASDEVGIVGTRYRAYFPPISRAGLYEMPIITELWPLAWLGWLPSPEFAALYVYVSDCSLSWGAD